MRHGAAAPVPLLVAAAAAAAACDVSVVHQISSSACTEGKSYGCYDGNNSMWADHGCGALFSCGSVSPVTCHSLDLKFVVCPCVADPPTPAPPPPKKYMLLDDRNVVTASATFALGKVKKHPAGAMIKEERDYEMRFDNMQPNVWYDPQLSKWRAWYSTFTSCSKPKETVPFCDNAPQKCGTPTKGVGAGRGSGFLYAESDDGIKWYKPDLNMTEWKGSKANNLIETDGMTTGIYLDETADPSERYKIATGSNGKGAVAVSADGIHWKNAKDLEGQTHGRWDTPKNVVWDPIQKQWIMYIRATPTANGMRIQSYTHSLTEDFMGDWSPATPTGLNTSADYQPDGLVGFPYEGIYIGIGNVFQTDSMHTATSIPIGQVNMVLGWSADGRRWKWLNPTESIIPHGADGDFDACGVFAAKSDPLRTVSSDDTLRMYYAGCNGPFFGSRGCALGMATLQRDGFGGYQGGIVTTAPVRVSGNTLKVSVDGGSSGVQVGIVGNKDYSVENCDPIKGQQTDVTVTWKGNSDIGSYTNGAIALEFKVPDDAIAFAFSL